MKNKIILLLIFCFWSWGVRGQVGYINTIVGTGTYGYTGDGGPATNATLGNISGIVYDANGNLYIADDYSIIRKISPAGIISTYAGSGTLGYSGDGGAATAAQLSYPTGLAIDNSGNLYVADGGNHTVRKISTSGIISTYAGTGFAGYSGDGGLATAAQLHTPGFLTFDATGNLFITESDNYTIRKVNSTGYISTVAGNNTSGYSGDNGPATAAQIDAVTGIVCDGLGNLFISDEYHSVVRKIDALGIISTYAGTYGGYSGDGGQASAAKFSGCSGLCYDASGNLYVSDQGNRVIRKIDGTGVISTIGGTPSSAGYSGDNGPATAAEISNVSSITVDPIGNLSLGDYNRHVVRMITLYNSAPTFVGGASQTLSVCQDASATSINSLMAITDLNHGDPETWSVTSGPSHGSVAATYSAAATGYIITPTGLSYTPASGYSGTDAFTVQVSDGTTTTSTTVTVTVIALPNAGSLSGTLTICAGANTTLSSSGDAGGTWISSNTTAATVSSSGVAHGLATGTTNISYSVTNSCGTDYEVTSVAVTDIPSPTVFGPITICVGAAVTMSDPGLSGTWSSTNTSVATINSSTGIATGIGTGTATISYAATNTCGTGYGSTFITVNDIPPLPVIMGTTSVCIGSVTTLSTTATIGLWSSSNTAVATVNSSTTTGVVHGVSAGTTDISYTATNTCGSHSGVASVTVTPLPTIGAGSSVSICSGASTTLTATGGVTYTWSPGTGLSATTGASPVAHPTVTTTYTVTGTNANGCVNTGTSIITVNPLPHAGVISGLPRIMCRGDSTSLSTSGDAGGTWSFPVNAFATVTPSTGKVFALIQSSSFGPRALTVKYTVTNSCGTDTAIYPIRIMGQPSLSILPNGAPIICVGETFTVTGVPNSLTYGSLTWTTVPSATVTPINAYSAHFIGNSAASPSLVFTYTYNYTADSAYCSSLVPTQSYTLVARPVITLTDPSILSTSGGATCAPHSGTITLSTTMASAYMWSTAGTSIVSLSCTTCSSNTVTGVGPGTETIIFSELGNRCVRRDTATLAISVGACKPSPDEISDNTSVDDVRVYPNPSTGLFTLEIPTGFDAASITVTNMNGKVIEAKITDKPKQDFDLSQYPRGIYIIAVDAGDKKYRQKLLLE